MRIRAGRSASSARRAALRRQRPQIGVAFRSKRHEFCTLTTSRSADSPLGCRCSGRGPPMVSGERRTAHGGADALVLSGRVFDLGAIENIARNGCLIKGRTPFTELRFGRAVTAAGARLQGSADFAFTGGTIFVSFPPCCSYVCAPTVPATLNPFFVRMSAA